MTHAKADQKTLNNHENQDWPLIKIAIDLFNFDEHSDYLVTEWKLTGPTVPALHQSHGRSRGIIYKLLLETETPNGQISAVLSR